jgi:chromosome segregation ATPase
MRIILELLTILSKIFHRNLVVGLLENQKRRNILELKRREKEFLRELEVIKRKKRALEELEEKFKRKEAESRKRLIQKLERLRAEELRIRKRYDEKRASLERKRHNLDSLARQFSELGY